MKHNNIDSQEIIHELGKSGAGISPTKVILAKYIMFPLLNRTISWYGAWNVFESEGQKIIDMSYKLDSEQLFQRVLVPKLFGLEDNSRYYSVAMVLEHLLSVGRALETRVPILSRGIELKGDIKIEDVKPYNAIDDDIVEQFEEFISHFREQIEDCDDIHIDNASPHPWFGAFNPKQWSILGMVHQVIHRRQIEAIIKAL